MATELERRGSLSVELHRLAWTLAAQTPSPRTDALDDEQPKPLWLALQIVHKSGQLLERFWFPADDDNTLTRSVSVDDSSSSSSNNESSTGDTQELDLAYQQSSKPLPLTSETVETLAHALLHIAVYSGTTRSRATDEVVGELHLPLVDAVLRSRIEQRAPVPTMRFARLEIDVCVQADVDLADFTAGCRVLRFHSFAVLQLPREWTLPCESDNDALQLCAAPERNLAAYELEIRLPALGDANNQAGGGSSTESVVVTGGKLQYEVASDATASPTNGDEPSDASTPPRLTGTWSVAFPVSGSLVKLFLKDAVECLRDFICVEKHIGATLRRSVVESAARVPDTVTAPVRIHLSELVRPGTSQFLASAKLKKVRPVARESLEQELASATTSDEKKKIQAALAEYDTTVQQAAAVSTSMAAAGTHIEATVEIQGAPLVLEPPAALALPAVSVEEMIAPRDVASEREQRDDPLDALREEIRSAVLTLVHEFDASCSSASAGDAAPPAADDVSSSVRERDEKRQKLVFRLNTQGVYHTFKEALKKRIVPVIRERFARAEFADDDDDDDSSGAPAIGERKPTTRANERKKEYMGQLYTLVMQQVHTVLHECVYSDTDALEKAHATAQGRPTAHDVRTVLDALKLKAMENLVNGDADKSEALHLDRIAFAEEHSALLEQQQQPQAQSSDRMPSRQRSAKDTSNGSATSLQHPSPYALESVWYDYARFSLAQGDVDRAGASLRQSLALNAHALHALLAHTALLCELRDIARAEDFAKAAVADALAAAAAAVGSRGDGASSVWTDVVLAHALLALYYTESSKDVTGNLALFELLKAQHVLQRDGGEPHACLSSVWIFLAAFAHELRLRSVARRALDLGTSFRKPRDVLSVRERVAKRAIAADLALLAGTTDAAATLLNEALAIDAADPFAWLVLGRVHLVQDSATEAAIECLQRALATRSLLRTSELRLSLLLHLGLVLLQASQFASAETVFLIACDEFRVASSWLGVGIACLRLEKMEAAHVALAEANRLDATSPDVWGYLALHALSTSPCVTPQDERDAKRFVVQALRYNLSNAVLLRELSNGFVAIDRLEDAEKLLRRSLVCQDSSLTRKTLADVLAAQNCAEDALEQYKQTLETSASVSERCALLEACAKLLTTLGRPEEAGEYRSMAQQFQIEHGGAAAAE